MASVVGKKLDLKARSNEFCEVLCKLFENCCYVGKGSNSLFI